MSHPTHYETRTRDRLTKRQEEILALVERSYTNGEIPGRRPSGHCDDANAPGS